MEIALCILCAVLALGVGAFFFFKKKGFQVVITQKRIDAALEEGFPVTKEHSKNASVTYANPQVTLLDEENRVQVSLDATLKLKLLAISKSYGCSLTISTGIRYEAQTHEFFLDNAVCERFQLDGVPDKWLAIVSGFGTLAAPLVERHPVYKLRAVDVKTRVAKMLFKGIEIRDQAVRVNFGL